MVERKRKEEKKFGQNLNTIGDDKKKREPNQPFFLSFLAENQVIEILRGAQVEEG